MPVQNVDSGRFELKILIYNLKNMKTCKICNQQFDNHSVYANHIRWKHKLNEGFSEKMAEATKSYYNKIYGKESEFIVNCKKCSKEFTITCRSKKIKNNNFCSRSCANTRKMTDSVKKKISDGMKKAWVDGKLDHIIYKMDNNPIFSSAAEREIIKFFKEKYKLDEWKSGGPFKYKNEFLVRDMYSDKLKVCFEYDGIWHFKDINGQLEKKQHKDVLLEEWCAENNYKLVRMQEGHFDSYELLENLIYNDSRQIIKYGNGYGYKKS